MIKEIHHSSFITHNCSPKESLYAGIIADNKDPKRLGRVKARLGMLGDAFTTPWLMPLGVGAGPNCGGFYPPPVGAGVVVMFAQGELESGWVLGGFWAQPRKVTEVPKAFQRIPPTNRGYQSPKGHLLEFDDLPPSAGIRLTTRGKRTLLLDDAKRRIVLSCPAKHALTLHDTDGVTLHAQGPLRGFAPTGSDGIEAPREAAGVENKGAQPPQGALLATSSGNAQVQLDPQGTVTVQSSAQAQLTLADRIVLRHPSGTTVEIGADGGLLAKTASGAQMHLDPQGGLLATSSGNAHVQLDPQGGLLAKSSSNAQVQLDPQGTVTLKSTAGAQATLSDKVVVKDPAGQSITLQAGKVLVQSAGSVELKAPSVTLAAGKLALGQGAALHPALAEKIAQLFNTHTHGTAMGPSTPPVVPMIPGAIGSTTVTVGG